jgi:prepilin-type N-terminal cleavage/methylation domain-containing protein
MRRRRGTRGFTLIEVLVATVILAIGLLAALTAFSMAARASGASRNDTIVPLLAEEQFAAVQTTPRDELVAGDSRGGFGDEYPDYSWDMRIWPQDELHRVRVDLVVHARQAGRTRDARFSTIIF